MKTQSISKKNLKEIYSVICEGWQKKLTEKLLWSEGKEVELEDEFILKGWNEADTSQKKLIEKYFTINTPKKLMDKIKNFQSILDLSGKELEEVVPWKGSKLTKGQKSQNALAKLLLIAEVYNEGWEPNWKNTSEYKWVPYKSVSGGDFSVGSYCWGYLLRSPSGAHFKTKEMSEDILVKFRDILDDYWMA